MKVTLSHLKRHAIASSLFPPTTLSKAIAKLGFVQADPIRSPARAQDLILRHRVRGYKAGDLERRYPALDLEEDFLYAYGFMPLSTWELLHRQPDSPLSAVERKVMEIVSAHKHLHPRQLEAWLGREREVNAWGGYSKATTRILHSLHHRGLLRIAGRENGVRLYTPILRKRGLIEPGEQRRRLILLIARMLAPVPEASLRRAIQLLAGYAPEYKGSHSEVTGLVDTGELAHAVVDTVRYVWPAGRIVRKEAPAGVRFLAPFDPLVWDRLRFEHFWGWRYRFEAYTPVAKRKLGYYAMPLLWGEDVVGWVNLSQVRGRLNVKQGYWGEKPGDASFRREFDAEMERFREFLIQPGKSL